MAKSHGRRRLLSALAAAALAMAALAPAGAPASRAEEAATPQSAEQIALSFAPLVRRTAPAVVNVLTYQQVRARAGRGSRLYDDPFFREFFGDRFSTGDGRAAEQPLSLGSGVILSADGVIVTNQHVIEGADSVDVVLSNGRQYDAELIGMDEATDLAVLRIDNGGEPLPFIEIADSDELQIGDLVLAIGNPFGVGQTVTSGIVSALARTDVGVADFSFFIQTDAAINPGNSGGGLIDMRGRLVGVNTAIYSESGGSLGIGFAIPSNMVARVVESVVTTGEVVRPWLGVSLDAVSYDMAQAIGLDRPYGALVVDVRDDSPAHQAGVMRGDVVIEIDGRDIENPEALRFRIGTYAVGAVARIVVMRDGERVALDVVLAEPPSALAMAEAVLLDGLHPLSGAEVVNLTRDIMSELELGNLRGGAYVTQVHADTPAAGAGLREGDIIVGVNGRQITSVAALRQILATPQLRWRISVVRDGELLSATLRGY